MELLLHKMYNFGNKPYLIFSNGAIYGPSGKRLKARHNSDGYAVVTMGSKYAKRSSKFVHRLVAEMFIPNPEGYSDVDHLDGNRMNPDMDNLEWTSHEENVGRAYRKGSYKGRFVGDKNPKAKLTPEIVMQLRKEYQAGITIMELHKKYGYPYNTIGNAVRYKTWTDLP